MSRGALILLGSALLVAAGGMAQKGLPAFGSVEGPGSGFAGSVGSAAPSPASVGSAVATLDAAPLAPPQEDPANPPYNGRYTFIRIRYDVADMRGGFGGRGRGGGGGRGPAWGHDYPRAETNFAKILEATTLIDTYREGYSGRILRLDDPELFKYPIASIIEVGYWRPSDLEVLRLREYLLKGGFLIVDDFRGSSINNFQYQMNRVLPDYLLQYVPMDHDIFDSFFYIEDPSALVPPYGRDIPQYLGIFEDNDPQGRIMVMINWNQDLQEYWEFSDRGYYPIDLSNEAYQFGVNYLIYAFTH